ncbi:MAG: hypothetical protein J7L15_04270 [Clostridiales bacterium]|nr:hypothetical protein [Clostridiales bacterium]
MTLDEYYKQYINDLNEFCRKYNLQEDFVNDTYIKLRKNYLNKTGLTTSDFSKLTKRAIWNRFIDETRDVKKKKTVYFDDVSDAAIEKSLTEQYEWEKESKLYQLEVQFLAKNLFFYLNSMNYSEIELFIFKTYVISGYTYKEIENKFNISIDKSKNIMRKMRKDIKNNLLSWIENKLK